jgi:Integrase core domain
VTSFYRLPGGYDAPSLAGLRRRRSRVVWSFVYLALRRAFELTLLCFRSEAKEIEILVSRHELAVLCRQHPRPTCSQRPCASRGVEPSAPSGAVGRECLDQLLIVSRRQLNRVLRRYVEHYNQYRPHRSLAHATPVPSERAGPRSAPNFGQLRRRDVLGGLIHEYEYTA